MNDNVAIKMASINGHTEIVKLLLADPRVDPGDGKNPAIKWVVFNGYTEIVELLLKDSRVNPADCKNFAIRMASKYGCVNIVKLLLKDSRVDPAADLNIIKQAALSGNKKMVKLLLKSLKHKFNTDAFIEILPVLLNDTSVEIIDLLTKHLVKYKWHIIALLEQHLTIDLMSQISCLVTIN